MRHHKDVSNWSISFTYHFRGHDDVSARSRPKWDLNETLLWRLIPGEYSYLKYNNDQSKKAKGSKCYVIKKKLKFLDYKNCLKASQTIIVVNYLEKKGINAEAKKEIKNRLTSKTEQIFKGETHNVFAEEINRIALSSYHDKRMK